VSKLARFTSPLCLVAFCAFSVWFALGAPNIGAVQTFETGNYPTQTGALAAVILLAWLPIIALGLAILVMMGRAAWLGVGAQEWSTQRRMQIGLILVMGAIVLSAGIARHFLSTPALHGGSVTQAQQLLKEHE
jgi:hypothetical protein